MDEVCGTFRLRRFGKLKFRFLKKFLPLRNGIPSHDTFRSVLGKLGPKRFNAALVKWRVETRTCWRTDDIGRFEDRSRARAEDIAENLAMLRHVVINVLRLDKSLFGGISVKRKELTWDDGKLLKLMQAA